MTLSKKKKDLLNTPMNQLGLGGAFNNWFFYISYMTQDQVLTLEEFISLNVDIKTNNDVFTCIKSEIEKAPIPKGFVKESKSWDKLRNFLIKNGFTQKDWILLLPTKKTGRGEVPDFKFLEKEMLLKMPVHKVTEVKPSCTPFKKIGNFILKEDWKGVPDQLKVEDILKLNPKKIRNQSFVQGYDGFDRTVMHTLLGIQKKFLEYGITEKDGLFMKAFLEPLKSEKSYIADLVQNLGFSPKDAQTAVSLGKKAGWI